jgi:UDP-N-acetyl-D-glucosamine dehydrogenase
MTPGTTRLSDLLGRLRDRRARVGVIGLGYVGLPLAVELARAGFQVTGIDLDPAKVRDITAGRSYIPDVKTTDLADVVANGRLRATSDPSTLSDLDVIDICVPTPLRKTKDPDLSFVVGAIDAVATHLRPGQLIILESTTYPSTTDEVAQPRLEAGGLKVERDFFLAFSPERVDPGNVTHTTSTIPKIVGGQGPASTEAAVTFYQQIVSTVVPVSSTRVAEMVKLLENTFRAVNIALVNEIAQMCHTLDIDVWEVIDAAGTKPFGFMPFYPGPGLGGHCIPIDPFYLSWKAREKGFECRFIELAGHVNASMPAFVVDRVTDALNDGARSIRGSRIHLYGVAYKRNVGDTRESPALGIIDLLTSRGAVLSYSDPFVPRLARGGHSYEAVGERDAIDGAPDCIVICTDHAHFDWAGLVASGIPVVDTRNALRGFSSPAIIPLSGRRAPTPAFA